MLRKLEERDMSLDRLADMPASEISAFLRLPRAGDAVAALVAQVTRDAAMLQRVG